MQESWHSSATYALSRVMDVSMTPAYMRHDSCIRATRIRGQVASHLWMGHGTRINESWHTYKWVVALVWKRRTGARDVALLVNVIWLAHICAMTPSCVQNAAVTSTPSVQWHNAQIRVWHTHSNAHTPARTRHIQCSLQTQHPILPHTQLFHSHTLTLSTCHMSNPFGHSPPTHFASHAHTLCVYIHVYVYACIYMYMSHTHCARTWPHDRVKPPCCRAQGACCWPFSREATPLFPLWLLEGNAIEREGE